MGTLTIEQLVTVDGVVADPDGGMRWVEATTPEQDDLTDRSQIAFVEGVEAILLGRRTYEMFARYWPVADPEREGLTPYINGLPKIVVSATIARAPWGEGEAEVVRPGAEGVTGVVRDVKARFGSVVSARSSSGGACSCATRSSPPGWPTGCACARCPRSLGTDAGSLRRAWAAASFATRRPSCFPRATSRRSTPSADAVLVSSTRSAPGRCPSTASRRLLPHRSRVD